MFSKKEDVETWYKTNCPHCDKTNWMYDSKDISPDSVLCWNCKKVFYMCGEEFLHEYYAVFVDIENPTTAEIIEHASIDQVDGEEKPFD